MKKYLMSGIAAIALCAAFTSCSKNENLYDENRPVEDVYAQYNAAFIEAFGQPAANQDWGFGPSRARTRTGEASWGNVIKPDMTTFPGYKSERCNGANRSPEGYADIVAPVTPEEAAWVQAWFSDPANRGLSEEGLDFRNFFVQNVSNNGSTKQGYAVESDGGSEKAKEYTGIYMDKLQIGPVASEAGTEHTLDFNATNGFNEWNLIYYQNGSALQFGYHASYNSNYQWLFRCQRLTVPAECFPDHKPHTGWYVGLSYYAYIDRANGKYDEIGRDRYDIADDWILKIVPGPGEYENKIRIIAEDLNAQNDPQDNMGDSDWDFNDVVFDVEYTSDTEATIQVMAAGGVLPLFVAGEEVHALFGESADANGRYPMINTAEGKHYEKTARSFTVSGIEKSNNGKDIEIKVIKKVNGVDEEFILTAANGQPASKIGVDPTFEWCNERQDITRRYPLFIDWVRTTEPWRWYGAYE